MIFSTVNRNPARIRVFDAGIERMFRSPTGPVVRDLERRAQNVVALATRRAEGFPIDIETGRLHSGIQYRIEQRTQGPIAIISTDAKKDGFSYPAFHDLAGAGEPHGGQRPWLSGALRAVLVEPGEAV